MAYPTNQKTYGGATKPTDTPGFRAFLQSLLGMIKRNYSGGHITEDAFRSQQGEIQNFLDTTPEEPIITPTSGAVMPDRPELPGRPTPEMTEQYRKYHPHGSQLVTSAEVWDWYHSPEGQAMMERGGAVMPDRPSWPGMPGSGEGTTIPSTPFVREEKPLPSPRYGDTETRLRQVYSYRDRFQPPKAAQPSVPTTIPTEPRPEGRPMQYPSTTRRPYGWLRKGNFSWW